MSVLFLPFISVIFSPRREKLNSLWRKTLPVEILLRDGCIERKVALCFGDQPHVLAAEHPFTGEFEREREMMDDERATNSEDYSMGPGV